ncbi:hypothetical protein ES703_48183 [subsurface metagenome]
MIRLQISSPSSGDPHRNINTIWQPYGFFQKNIFRARAASRKRGSWYLALILLFLFLLGCAHRDPWTKTDTKLALGLAGASIADIVTTKQSDSDEYCHPWMDEKNVIPLIVVTDAAILGASWFFPEKARRALLLSWITMRLGFSLRNLVQYD